MVLYDLITGQKTPNGTWGYISGPVGQTPSAPTTYDEDFDFSGFLNGTYVFGYSVGAEGGCTSQTTVTVVVGNINFFQNDECDNSVNITTHFSLSSSLPLPEGTTTSEANELFTTGCEKDIATPSDDEPWVTPTDGDLWFRIPLPTISPAANYNFSVQINSTAYGGTGLQNSQLALYVGPDCDTLTLLDQTEGTGSTTSLVAFTTGAPAFCFVRVGAKSGNEGFFDINITT